MNKLHAYMACIISCYNQVDTETFCIHFTKIPFIVDLAMSCWACDIKLGITQNAYSNSNTQLEDGAMQVKICTEAESK